MLIRGVDEFGKRSENDALMFLMEGNLPRYFGYCLVPVEKSVTDQTYLLNYDLSISKRYLELRIDKYLYEMEFSEKVNIKKRDRS